MTATIVNAAPMTIMLGTQDKSTRAVAREAEALPTHLPLLYLFAQKGLTDVPYLVSGAEAQTMFGKHTFDVRQPYATHATELANRIIAKGNAVMIKRLRPADAGPDASLRLSLDLLPCQIDDYERNSDGSIKVNGAGTPIVSGQIAGYKAKWVVTPVPVVDGVLQVGLGTQGPGDQVDGETQSTRYPMLDFKVTSFGAHGNNLGVRLWAPTAQSTQPLDARIVANEKVYPFRLACVQRTDELTTPTVVPTENGEQFVQACFKANTINRLNDSELGLEKVFLEAYQDLDNPNFPPAFGPFNQLAIYDEQIATVLDLVYTAEVDYIDAFSDFTGEVGEEYRFNLIGGCSSQGVPYHSFQLVTGVSNSVRLTEAATLYAQGGSDGTMGETVFASLVSAEIAAFGDENSVMQDTARYPVSIFYDSGFPLETKYDLLNFISLRKDTFLVLATHDVLGLPLTASEESAMAVALRTRAQMFPESEYFGTPVMRCMIVGRSGTLIGSKYSKALPLTLDVAEKAAAYMGAGNGKWKSDASFDDDNVVTSFKGINVTFTPAKARNKDWANGLNWVESYGHRSVYFPALKTVYDNDTSVLTSFLTAMACVELQKVGERARRRYSGNSKLTQAQIVERVNQFVTDDVEGRFDGRFVIQPAAYFTQRDVERGFSWTLPIKLYAANMKTVMTLSIEAYRIEDLQ